MTAKLFEVICAGCLRAVVSMKVQLARWTANCDTDVHLSPSKHLGSKGYRIVQHDGQDWAENFACPKCGVKRITRAGTPSCQIAGGKYGSGTPSPGRMSCQACGQWAASSGELIELLFTSQKERLKYLEQNCRNAEPQNKRYMVARFGGETALRKSTQEAIDAVLPVDFEPGVEVEIVLIEALDEPMALTIARDIPDDAYVSVPVNAQCEHSAPGWHGQRLTVEEQRHAANIKQEEDRKRHAANIKQAEDQKRIDGIKRAEDQKRHDEIEREIRAIAAERVDQRRTAGTK
jgi:predicted RNA-binding Zn-ribbon protein involved in translation (DUF1610 family)